METVTKVIQNFNITPGHHFELIKSNADRLGKNKIEGSTARRRVIHGPWKILSPLQPIRLHKL